MSHAKARLNRGARPKYLGVKLYNGQEVKAGQVIVKQRGTNVLPGKNVRLGRDHTLYAGSDGIIKFATKKVKGFNNVSRKTKIVSVIAKES